MNNNKGQAVILFVLSTITILGISSLAVEIGANRVLKNRMQTAADSAALAGAQELPNQSTALQTALNYSRLNGFQDGTDGVRVETAVNPDNSNNGRFRVTIRMPQQNFLSKIFPTGSASGGTRVSTMTESTDPTISIRDRLWLQFANYLLNLAQSPRYQAFSNMFTRLANQILSVINIPRTASAPPARTLQAISTVQVSTHVPLQTTSASDYGSSNGGTSLLIGGPYSPYTAGDPYSSRYLNRYGSGNPDYRAAGYDFNLEVSPLYAFQNRTSLLQIEVYDPDSYVNAQPGPNDTVTDINLPPDYTDSNYRGNTTTTTFSLYRPDNTPNNTADDQLILTQSFGNNSNTDNRWVGQTIDTSYWGYGNYRIQVQTTNGSGINVFKLRAGPPPPATSTALTVPSPAFNPNNGTRIASRDFLPVTVQSSGTQVVPLGYIPASAAGRSLTIKNFDADQAGQSVVFNIASTGQYWTGTLSDDGQWASTTITLPSYFGGGNLNATFQNTANSTSSWGVWYDGVGDGRIANIRIVANSSAANTLQVQ